MFEIAETFMDSEDYDQAVKFYDRFGDLNNYAILIVQLLGSSKGLAHYRRAVDNLREK